MVYTRQPRRSRQEEQEEPEKAESRPEATRSRERRRRSRDEKPETSAEQVETFDKYRRRLERDRYFTQAIEPPTVSSPSPSRKQVTPTNMSTTAAGNKLAKEIHDEFLTCKICLEGFKSPKCLECLHTFCEQCIDNHVLTECSYKKYSDYREFTCPLCRKRTQLPLGGVKKLPDNFLVSSLGEVVSRQKPSKFPYCDICKLINRKHREATSKCIDCNKLLCKQCVDMHKDTKVTQSHSLFDVEIEKDIECKEHEDEVVRFYCEPCQTCICVLCTFNEHKDHEISQFGDAVTKYKENIEHLLGSCKGKIDVYDRQLALINKCEGSIRAAEQRIKDSAIHFIAEVRNKEKNMIEELHSVYGKELMEYINRKNEMQNNLDGLKSTCNLTELVLKGKDIELLLLKKQVQEKLSVVSEVELKDLPRTVGKSVSFMQGSLEFGKLDDPDVIDKKKDREEDSQRLTLPNMVFGQRNRDRDIHQIAESKPEISVAQTQTDPMVQQVVPTKASLHSTGIQTEYPEYWNRDNSSTGSSRGGRCESSSYNSGLETRGTTTDVVSTTEKAVNTRSRILQAVPSQASSRDESPSTHVGVDSSSGMESPVTRRHRRRRERVRPVEVSVRPTTGTGTGSSDGNTRPKNSCVI